MFARRLPFYLLREFVPLYLVGLVTILMLLMIDFFAFLAASFINYHTSIDVMFRALLDRMPFFLSYMIAPSLAFAVLVGLGRLAKDSELKAVYSSGIRPITLLAPILLVGALATGLSWVNENIWRPVADQRFKTSYYAIWHSEPPRVQALKSYASEDESILYHAGSILPDKDNKQLAELSGVMITTPKGIYTATRGRWDANAKTWELYNVYHTTDTETQAVSDPEVRRVFPFTLPVEPDLIPPEALPLPDLIARASSKVLSQSERYDAQFKLHRRFSDPLAAMLMAIVGGALGLTISNRAWGFAGTIGLITVYWGLWQIGFNLASAQALAAPLAAWLPSAIFGIGALFGLRRLL
jgi:lipopolysaccharide export system permease protein